MADLLRDTGIARASGFALNVAGYDATAREVADGESIAAHVGGKRFVIDTSRNGNGSNGEWCNPPGDGSAHAFAIFDLLRGRCMGWAPTGTRVRDRRVRWFRICIALWGGGTAPMLIGACVWRVLARHYAATQFVPTLIFASIYLRTNPRIILFGARAGSGRGCARPSGAGRHPPTRSTLPARPWATAPPIAARVAAVRVRGARRSRGPGRPGTAHRRCLHVPRAPAFVTQRVRAGVPGIPRRTTVSASQNGS